MQFPQKSEKEIESPKTVCGKELKGLKQHLLPIDRKKAVSAFNIHYVTVSRYVNGRVGNISLGIRMLNFFLKRIRKRANELKTLCKDKEG